MEAEEVEFDIQIRWKMLRLLSIFMILIFSSCVSSYRSSTNIAIIRGESLNHRVEARSPAPYESRIAMECLELESKPSVTFYSRNRALELFKSGQVDVVVSGQASVFPDKFIQYRRIKDSTKALILYKESFTRLGEAIDIPKGVKVGVLENSAFSSYFVKRAGDLEVKVFRLIETGVQAIKNNEIDCLVIDQLAVDHISSLLPKLKRRPLDLPSKAVVWLYR